MPSLNLYCKNIFQCNNFEKRGKKEAKFQKKRQKRQIHKKRGTKEARGKKRQKEARGCDLTA